MSAENMAEYFVSHAAANNHIMVFPQAQVCWDYAEMYTGENAFTTEGPQMLFMKEIANRVTLDSTQYPMEKQ